MTSTEGHMSGAHRLHPLGRSKNDPPATVLTLVGLEDKPDPPDPSDNSTNPPSHNAISDSSGHSISRGRGKKKLRRKFSTRAFLALMPLIGQIFLMTFTWGFWGYIVGRGYLLLPDQTATFLNSQPFVVTITTTLIGTCLSLFSTFLFSTALKDAIRAHISRPISLLVLSVLIELSKGEFVFRLRHRKWTISTLITTIALNTMTAGWTGLLQPAPILVAAGISGIELDLSSPALNTFLKETLLASDPTVVGLSENNIFPFMDSSGIASVNRLKGQSNVINYRGAAFEGSTGGIIPSGPLHSENFKAFLPSGEELPTYHFESTHPQLQGVFDFNISMTQQGFSADISCQESQTSVMQPTMRTLSENLHNPNFGGNIILTRTNWTATCPSGNSSAVAPETLTASYSPSDSDRNMLMGLICPFENLDGKFHWSTHVLLVQGSGKEYAFIKPSICAITPIITTNKVLYSKSSILVSNGSQRQSAQDERTSQVGLLIAQKIAARFQTSQGLWGSSIGDALAAFDDTFSKDDRNTNVNTLLEEYLLGLFEFRGTWLRSFFADAFRQVNEFPPETRKAFYGLLHAESWGWDRGNAAQAIVLMPMTFVALMTAFVTMMTYELFDNDEEIATMEERELKPEREKFDPTSPFHLILAASGGGIRELVSGFSSHKMAQNETIEVHFGDVSSTQPGFVQDVR